MPAGPALPRLAVLLLSAALVSAALPARAQDDTEAARSRLDRILAVLRTRTSAAGPACLKAMTTVHDTESQVGDLAKRESHGDSDRDHPDLDMARDVLSSDYEDATAACTPDAMRACGVASGDPAMARSCGRLNASPPP